MKKTSLSLLFGVLGCMISFTLPTFGVHMSSSPVRDEPDTVYTDTLEEGDPEALDSIWVEDFEETFEDSVVVDNASMVESGVCEPNYELLGEMDEKMADFSLSHSKDANFGISFSASIFTPTTIKKGSPYHRMVADILNATMPETDEPVKFESRDIERMLELKWRTLKERYEFETTDLPPLDYNYRTSVTPAWTWTSLNGTNLTTYKVEDEVYTGGAHGMNYEYYLTLDAKQGVLGLTDLFKEERLMEIFELVHTKLVARRTEPQDETTWNTNADIDTPATGDAMRRAGQVEEFQGKWYPRPARTACGYVFTYAPYEKDCYAAGTIHILLTPEEVEGMTK